ncbi:MAG: aldehyde dehydrogenase family protein [Saprospiraceae bacterium]
MSSTIELRKEEISVNTSPDEIIRIFKLQQVNIFRASTTSVESRINKLKHLKQVFLSHRQDLKDAMFKDYNKPGPEVDLAEIFVVLNELNFTIRKLKSWTAKHRVGTPWFLMGSSSYVHYEAKGNVLVISPWNFPIHLTLMPLIHSFAAGNVTLIKPSEYTPYTIEVVKKIITKVFEPYEAAVIEGSVPVTTQLLSFKFNHIFFTGSPKVGKIVMKAAAEHLASVTLELGGKSPLIIDSSANMNLAIQFIASAKFVNAGQYCIAPDYIYVHQSIKDVFITKLVDGIKYRYGQDDASRIQGNYSRIVNQLHTQRVSEYIEEAIQKGATLVYGGDREKDKEYIGPTIFTDVTDDMAICTQEIFGPVVYIKTFEDISEVIEKVNAGEKPLSMYLFSENIQIRQRVRKEISAGGLNINAVAIHYYNYNLPFGGVNNSGLGKSHGFHSFQEFSNAKAVLHQWFKWPSIALMFPPFTKTTRKLIDLLIRIMS